jgi:hypothetical protein
LGTCALRGDDRCHAPERRLLRVVRRAALCITGTVTWRIIYFFAAGTEVSRESTTPAAATDRSA